MLVGAYLRCDYVAAVAKLVNNMDATELRGRESLHSACNLLKVILIVVK